LHKRFNEDCVECKMMSTHFLSLKIAQVLVFISLDDVPVLKLFLLYWVNETYQETFELCLLNQQRLLIVKISSFIFTKD
jgi:Cu/Ag efflux pump CusA